MAKQKNILIVGYGAAGKSLRDSLRANDEHVEGFLDDKSTAKAVLGKLADVNRVVSRHAITDIYFAIPSAPASVVREFLEQLEDKKVRLAIIPRTFQTITKETVNINELTDIDIMSLIGRQPVKHDLLACRELIRGKTVIITGGAGSIGSKLVKLVAELDPAKVVCVDWWENGTFFLQQDLRDKSNVEFKIADIKNPHVVNRIFSEYKPDLVFHAAAYKHVPLMQHNAIEAFNNNVWGTLNLMRQAINHKVQNFVMVSTDKAVNPVNVMGTSKRLGEMLMEVLANLQHDTKFNAVRFGNVIQSNGSLMQIYKRQIEKGLPLPVTHKDMTRYFMTVEEASQLVVQSALLGKNGEIFVLDMGEPIKIIDLANSLVRLLGKHIKIKVTGPRPGEKMFEELSYDPANVGRTPNKKVFIVKNEKEFDHAAFMDAIDTLIEETLEYKLTAEEVIAKLRGFGFQIRD